MTDATTSRRCGNCGGVVGATDITCPHCDALLAAYEAPSGAVAGPSAAVTPVDASTPPATPVAHAAPTPVEPPTSPSPVATAVAMTKAAAEEHDPVTAADGDDAWPLSSAPLSTTLAEPLDLDTMPDIAPVELPTPTPSPAASPVREALAATKAKVEASPEPERIEDEGLPESVRRVREQQRQGWTTQSLPNGDAAPDAQARPTSPRVTQLIEQPRASISTTTGPAKKPTSKSGGAPVIVIVIAVFIFMRAAGSSAAIGTLLTVGVIAFMIWFVVRLANATGRKTTQMPRDDWRPRR
ncbi:MAG TPA: hypothetical protein VM450_07825 [Thermomicrobiales bacterium]|nr:hypothetical protein [Thermomicrobiales bacterium]